MLQSEGLGEENQVLFREIVSIYILLLQFSALFPGATVHPELLYPTDPFQMTQLALANEEVVNFRVESAEKLFVHVRTKLSDQQESLSIELNRIHSSQSGCFETSL